MRLEVDYWTLFVFVFYSVFHIFFRNNNLGFNLVFFFFVFLVFYHNRTILDKQIYIKCMYIFLNYNILYFWLFTIISHL